MEKKSPKNLIFAIYDDNMQMRLLYKNYNMQIFAKVFKFKDFFKIQLKNRVVAGVVEVFLGTWINNLQEKMIFTCTRRGKGWGFLAGVLKGDFA